jgi:hypothetical protein
MCAGPVQGSVAVHRRHGVIREDNVGRGTLEVFNVTLPVLDMVEVKDKPPWLRAC